MLYLPGFLKHCTKCGEYKFPTPDYFARDKRAPAGLTFACKTCRVAQTGKWQKANHPKVLEQGRRHRQKYRREINEDKNAKYRENPERFKAAIRKSESLHKDRVRKSHREWARQHSAEAKARSHRHYLTNKSKYTERAIRRRQAKNAVGHYSDSDIKALYAQQQGKCAYCRCELNHVYDIDHVIPLSRSGTNWPDNLKLACRHCNRSKSAKLLWSEWIPPNPL